jgi:hypothetical protein
MGKFEKKICNLDANMNNKRVFCGYFSIKGQLLCDLHNNFFGHSKMFDPYLIIILHHEKN